jgi:hypothetical protein
MQTLGIDLASADKNTALCLLDWHEKGATVAELRVGVTDALIVEAHGRANATGIDCPFGWPDGFRSMVASDAVAGAWSEEARDRLRFRLTDTRVHDAIGRWPLSVSSDLIAVPAMRCHLLLDRLGVTDRSGDGRVFEVYPAASLARWDLTSRGYKGRKGQTALHGLVRAFRERAPWLDLGTFRDLLSGNDDAFDALIAALSVRAAKVGLTSKPTPEEHTVAAREGWIALPELGCLDRLRVASDPASAWALPGAYRSMMSGRRRCTT